MPTSRRSPAGLAARLAPALLAALVADAAPAVASEPLSAIDWLSRAQTLPVPPPPLPPVQGAEETAAVSMAPLSDGLETGAISVASLDAPTADAVGLMPADRAGFPPDLWGVTPSAELAAALARLGPDTLPALQDLTLALMVAELDPPADAEGRGALFAARIDKLMDFGALDQALALLEAAGPAAPGLFRRWFDISLLMGEDAEACAALRRQPGLDEAYAARVYCHARGGDWEAATLTLRSAEALEAIPPAELAALHRFLDPDIAEYDGPLPAPGRPSPLLFRLMDAIGEPLPSYPLPLAFAHGDLGSAAGWRAQIEAAERLTRAGALAPNRLLGLYTERRPSASGGVWTRAAAIQRLEGTLLADDAEALADALGDAWSLMAEAELEVAFARLYAERLLRRDLGGEAGGLVFRMALLAGETEAAAAAHAPTDAREAFLLALATGTSGADPAGGGMAEAVHEAFRRTPDTAMAARIEDGQRGAVLLEALAMLRGGGIEDPRTVSDGLALLRHVGQERAARRAGLEILLLDRRG